MLINIIGAGKLGQTLGYLFAQKTQLEIAGIYNQSFESSQVAQQFISSGHAVQHIDKLPLSDITLIATRDEDIQNTCVELAKAGKIKKESIVFHCSGILDSDVLSSAKVSDAYIASIHPMISIAKPEMTIHQFSGTFCALEGDENALKLLSPLFKKLGADLFVIQKKYKALYHTAAVFSSNYTVTLINAAIKCLEEADFKTKDAKRIILHLGRSALLNIEQNDDIKDALTGPIQRGDVETLEKNIESLTDESLKKLYRILGKSTLELTNHDDYKYDLMLKLLDFSYAN